MKSPERPLWRQSAAFIGSSGYSLELPTVDVQGPTVYV